MRHGCFWPGLAVFAALAMGGCREGGGGDGDGDGDVDVAVDGDVPSGLGASCYEDACEDELFCNITFVCVDPDSCLISVYYCCYENPVGDGVRCNVESRMTGEVEVLGEYPVTSPGATVVDDVNAQHQARECHVYDEEVCL